MSDYSLVQRAVISATSADGAGPKDATLSGAIKTASAFVVARIKDRRRDVSVQRGTQEITDASVSPIDITITSVDTTAAEVAATIKEKRTNDRYGATVELTSATNLRIKFDTVAAGDTISVAYEVRERKSRRGATVRIVDEDTIRMEWDGTLVAGETIDAAVDVFDFENAGDDLKEILFRLERVLAIGGENSIRDLHTYDQAGNPTAYRVRTFDTQANAEVATIDLPEGDALETGELSRHSVTLDWSTARNRPKSIVSVRTDLLATPDVD